ncbi:Hypothetical protein PBC10988_8270 [Planctomycetales bacterium 10988]|nr:Hypothetical protein PBC10988_8270 [Planctomycetales bacterium 10988]
MNQGFHPHFSRSYATCCAILFGMMVLWPSTTEAAKSQKYLPPLDLPGCVIDDTLAEFKGEWQSSVSTAPFVDESYRYTSEKGATARFLLPVPKNGKYEVGILYSAFKNRSSKVSVTIESAEGKKVVHIDQRKKPEDGLFLSLGTFKFVTSRPADVILTHTGANGVLVADAIQLAPTTADLEKSVAQWKESRRKLKDFQPIERTTEPVARLTSQDLDRLVADDREGLFEAAIIDDITFLRRSTMDLIGRPPSLEEQAEYRSLPSEGRRSEWIERLLDHEDFGKHWANYWSDVISVRVPQPELTFLNYTRFENWLAEQLNENVAWDETVQRILTASGEVRENPEATFVGFHEGNPVRLAGETTRIFLSVEISCSECHDAPFQEWERHQFHEMAAFFGRVSAKLPWRDSDLINVKADSKGEYVMPDMHDPSLPGEQMVPTTLLNGQSLATGADDRSRRYLLARWVSSSENPWFAKSFTNRTWANLMGRGFCEPVENLPLGDLYLPDVHDELSQHFIDNHFNVKEMLRLITNSRAYQLALPLGEEETKPFAAGTTKRLRGDEVFEALAVAVEISNVTPPPVEHSKAFRFPPPPQSTRDRVAKTFGYDPSVDYRTIERTMQQAMWLMNDDALQAEVNADPKSGTILSQLLQEHEEDNDVVKSLFQRTLSREPSAKELEIALQYVKNSESRGQGFEDLLWSLLNSTEFTTKR